jgi:hypothetical protein
MIIDDQILTSIVTISNTEDGVECVILTKEELSLLLHSLPHNLHLLLDGRVQLQINGITITTEELQ